AREAPNDWPAGQEWDDLVGSSHAIFRDRARAEAGVDLQWARALLFDRYGHRKPFTNPPGTPLPCANCHHTPLGMTQDEFDETAQTIRDAVDDDSLFHLHELVRFDYPSGA